MPSTLVPARKSRASPTANRRGLLPTTFAHSFVHEVPIGSDLVELHAPVLCAPSIHPTLGEEDLIVRCDQTFKGMGILNFRKQLSILTHPKEFLIYPTEHTRREHTITAALIGRGIINNNRQHFSQRDAMLLEVALMLHDIATPAGGDALKPLDPLALDEETRWRAVIGEQGNTFIKSLGLTPREVGEVILNKGVLGELLDIADRLSYICTDAYRLFVTSVSSAGRFFGMESLQELYRDVLYSPKEKRAYFRDPERLAKFLLLRSYLFSEVYARPDNQFRDALLRALARPLYSKNGATPLTPTSLRLMPDGVAYDIIGNFYMIPDVVKAVLDTEPISSKYPNLEEARIAEKQVPKGFRALTTRGTGFKTGTGYLAHTLSIDDTNRLAPLSEIFPEIAAAIQDDSDTVTGYFVHRFKEPDWLCGVQLTADSLQ